MVPHTIIPALGRHKQENHCKLRASQVYVESPHTARLSVTQPGLHSKTLSLTAKHKQTKPAVTYASPYASRRSFNSGRIAGYKKLPWGLEN